MKQKHKYFYTKQTKKEPRPERDRWLKSRISHHYRKGSVYAITYTSDNFGLYSCWRIDAFVLSCGRRLLRVPWIARSSNLSTLKEINPEYSLEGLKLKLKPQYSGHLIWRANSLEKTVILGKIEGRRKSGWQRMRWLNSISNSMDMSLSKLQEKSEGQGSLQSIGSQRVGHD